MCALILPSSHFPDAYALSPTELRAAELDGELVRLGDAYLPIDMPVGPRDRARSVTELRADSRLFAHRSTAAWIYGWCAEPARHTLAVSVLARVPSGTRMRTGARELVIDDDEVSNLGGAAVTTPTRTLLDLARDSDNQVPLTELARIIGASGQAVQRLLTQLEGSRRAPFASRARQRLSAVADSIDVVDRIDASHGVEDPIEVRDVAHLEDEFADGQAVA
jgi:hypothetical protein